MRRMWRAVALAAVLTPTLASATLAQRRALAETGPIARRASLKVPKQQPTPTMTGPDWSIFGGVASGDDEYDIGIAAGGTGRWRRSDWPVGVRGDVYYAHHSGDIGEQLGGIELSVNIFGVIGSAEYSFPIENRLKPYVFGGLGLFYSNVNVDYDGLIDEGRYDSSTDLGVGVGGGIYLTPRLGLELRFLDAGGFATIPVVAVFHF